ncbi:hypothetical protein [Gordonia sp. NB41Y]|uniref:hypothetical protein n=1 Tax=Gordonia sp. NB41Y TaxID=875808 RepID=UPI0006B1C42E|nr:hypothetical protein [Gordonia sp. NB41Y]KOY49340.1 hypothetical protein ISGA_10875 [Gordonia sp. NB41Y]WLP91538.1 hypothetical protein Q9K23_04575 [Gordonia sp. NB41Y]
MSYPPGPPQGYGYPTPPPQQPPRSPWSSPVVLVAIAIGLLVVIGAGIAAWALTRNSSDSDSAGATSTTPSTSTSTFTSTVTQTQGGAPVPTQTQTTTRTTTARPSVSVSGADWQGFLSGPRCNAADDPAVAIGQTTRSRVVICQVGAQTGRWYYKGLADGNTIEIGYPQQVGNSFVAQNGSTTYTVSPSSVVISQNGSTLADEPMLAYWSLS